MESLRQRCVEVDVARRVQDAAARVAVGVRRRRDEIGRVEPRVHRRVVERARADAVRPARRAVVDAGLQVTVNGRPVVTVVMPASCQPPTSAPSSPPSPATSARAPRQLVNVADDGAVAHVEAGRARATRRCWSPSAVADGTAAARRRSAVVERLAVGVADEELQAVAEPLLHFQRAGVDRSTDCAGRTAACC